MGKFTKIPKDTFDNLQIDAGVLLKKFSVETANFEDADLICATTGGITVNCTPSFSDYGEDVDNCPNNMLELKHIDSYDCSIAFTSLGMSPELIALAVGAATVDGNKVTPKNSLDKADFKDIWWVGDKADGGMVAVHLFNALSTGGLSIQTTKNGKGQASMTMTGHFSIEAQDVVPIEFYSTNGTTESEPSGGTVRADAYNLRKTRQPLKQTETEAADETEEMEIETEDQHETFGD